MHPAKKMVFPSRPWKKEQARSHCVSLLEKSECTTLFLIPPSSSLEPGCDGWIPSSHFVPQGDRKAEKKDQRQWISDDCVVPDSSNRREKQTFILHKLLSLEVFGHLSPGLNGHRRYTVNLRCIDCSVEDLLWAGPRVGTSMYICLGSLHSGSVRQLSLPLSSGRGLRSERENDLPQWIAKAALRPS